MKPNQRRKASRHKEDIMQPWQIKALELESSALKSLDGFVHEHALYFLVGAIYLLLALLAWVLSGALRRKGGKSTHHVRPAIIIRLPGSPPPPPDPFPPFRETRGVIVPTMIWIEPGRRAAARSLRVTNSPRRRSLPRNRLAGSHSRRCSALLGYAEPFPACFAAYARF